MAQEFSGHKHAERQTIWKKYLFTNVGSYLYPLCSQNYLVLRFHKVWIHSSKTRKCPVSNFPYRFHEAYTVAIFFFKNPFNPSLIIYHFYRPIVIVTKQISGKFRYEQFFTVHLPLEFEVIEQHIMERFPNDMDRIFIDETIINASTYIIFVRIINQGTNRDLPPNMVVYKLRTSWIPRLQVVS